MSLPTLPEPRGTQEGRTLSTMNSKGSSQRLQPHLRFKQREPGSLSRALRQLFPDRNASLDQPWELLPLEQQGWAEGSQFGFTLAVLHTTGSTGIVWVAPS